MAKYKCNNCGNLTNTPRTRGSGWIEIILYLFVFIIGGVIYSIWRRSGAGLCPTCKKDTLIPASAAPVTNASAPNATSPSNESSTVQCKWCAETIQAKARVCRFCQKPVTPMFVEDSKANKQIAAIDTLHSKGHSSEKIAAFLKSKNQVYLADNSDWTAEKVDKVIAQFIENSQPNQNQNTSQGQKTPRTLKQHALRGLSWGFGGLLFAMGLIVLIPMGAKSSSNSLPWAGFILIAISSLLLPPIREYVHSKTKFEIPIKARTIVIATLCVVFGAMSGYQSYENSKARELAAQQAQEEAKRIAQIKQDKIDYFRENRETILAKAKSDFNAKNFEVVIAESSKYAVVDDSELKQLHAKSSNALATIKKAEESERLRLASEEEKNNWISMLKRESKGIDNFDINSFLTSKETMVLGIAAFSVWAKIAEEGNEYSLNNSERVLLQKFKTKVSAFQSKAFPKMRDALGPIMRKSFRDYNLSSADSSVKTFGKGFRTIEFSGRAYSTKANIKQFHSDLSQFLQQLRFKQARYKATKNASRYTYYDINGFEDVSLVILEKNGQTRKVDGSPPKEIPKQAKFYGLDKKQYTQCINLGSTVMDNMNTYGLDSSQHTKAHDQWNKQCSLTALWEVVEKQDSRNFPVSPLAWANLK